MEAANRVKPKREDAKSQASKTDTRAYDTTDNNPSFAEYEDEKDNANNRLRWGVCGNKWFGYHPEENGGSISPTKCTSDFYGRTGRIDDHYNGRQEFPSSAAPPVLPQYDQRIVGHFRTNDSYGSHGEDVYKRAAFCVDHPYAWDRNGLCRTCSRPWQLI